MPMPREGETIGKLLDYGYKVDYPNGQVAEVKARFDESGISDTRVKGLKVGVSGNISTLQTQTKVSDRFNATVGTQGPSVGGAVGFQIGSETGASAIVEPSLAKIDGNIGPVYGSVGLNANTGFKLGRSGVKACFLGFGLNLGVGGKFTVDTPVGSVGGTVTQTQSNAINTRSQSRRREDNVEYAS